MPSRAIRDKERRWKLARNAVWGCVPARLGSEVPATWVPATELVPGGERAPWSSRSWGMSVWGAGQEAWAQVGATGVDGRLFGNVRVFRYRHGVGASLYVLAQPARAGDVPVAGYAAPHVLWAQAPRTLTFAKIQINSFPPKMCETAPK